MKQIASGRAWREVSRFHGSRAAVDGEGNILPARDVADETKCITARFDQYGDGLVHAVPFSRSESNFGPLRAGELRNFEPDPDAPAGDDDGLVLKTHVSASLKGDRSSKFPFGFERVNGLGFFVAAVALKSVGLLLLYNAAVAFVTAEHASVGSIVLLGHDFSLGWVMIGAQLYSLVRPMLIGRKELPLAETLNDKLLQTNALMNKAN